MGNIDEMVGKQKLGMGMMTNPHLPAWHAQREKMALASLGSCVQNMERTSGCINGSIPQLEPARAAAMHDAGMRQYAVAKGDSPAIFDARNKGPMDVDISGMMGRTMPGFTVWLARQGAKDTKVKLRFDNVHHPDLVAECCKVTGLPWTTRCSSTRRSADEMAAALAAAIAHRRRSSDARRRRH